MFRCLIMSLAALTVAACSVSAKPEKLSTHPEYVKVESEQDFPATLKALKEEILSRDMTIFSTIDHAMAAGDVDMELTPTTLILFGDPKAGTPLMQQDPTLAMELPLRMLVQQRGDDVLLIYPDIWKLKGDFELEDVDKRFVKIENLLADIAMSAAELPEEAEEAELP